MRENLAKHLHRLTMPVLLIWGKEDKITPPFVGEDFHRLLVNSELVLVEHCGHAPMMEKPEEFNRILDEFLQKLNVVA